MSFEIRRDDAGRIKDIVAEAEGLRIRVKQCDSYQVYVHIVNGEHDCMFDIETKKESVRISERWTQPSSKEQPK